MDIKRHNMTSHWSIFSIISERR